MRIRTIKPEFWQSEDLAEVSDKAKLLAIGLLNMADDEGYLKCHSALIRSHIFPFIEDSLNIQGMLNELSNANYITLLLGDDGKDYLVVKNFSKHQKVNRPTPSKIRDSIEFTELSVSDTLPLTGGKERKGKERKGKEQGKELMSTKADDDAQSIFDYWKVVMQKNNSSILNKKRKVAITGRLKEGYSVDQIKQAIDGCSNTPHNMGKNDNNKLYNDIELICRDGVNLERFAGNVSNTSYSQDYSGITQRNINMMQSLELK
jgi:hypothetical protein